VTEQALNSRKEASLTRHVNNLAVLTNGKSTNDELIAILGLEHSPKVVEHLTESLIVSDRHGKAGSSCLSA